MADIEKCIQEREPESENSAAESDYSVELVKRIMSSDLFFQLLRDNAVYARIWGYDAGPQGVHQAFELRTHPESANPVDPENPSFLQHLTDLVFRPLSQSRWPAVYQNYECWVRGKIGNQIPYCDRLWANWVPFIQEYEEALQREDLSVNKLLQTLQGFNDQTHGGYEHIGYGMEICVCMIRNILENKRDEYCQHGSSTADSRRFQRGNSAIR